MYSRKTTFFNSFAPVKLSRAHLYDTCTTNDVFCRRLSVPVIACSIKRVSFIFLLPQVINIINAAQESSPVTVAEALDRVLEILRTTELYSPQLASKEDDPHGNDLVGGLMNVRSSI